MRLMTSSELAGKTEGELATLFGSVSKKLVRTQRGTAERRNVLATLENISRARASQLSYPGM